MQQQADLEMIYDVIVPCTTKSGSSPISSRHARRKLIKAITTFAFGAIILAAQLAFQGENRSRHLETLTGDDDDGGRPEQIIGEANVKVATLSWFLGMFSAVAIKLTSSIDDVVWLAPFMAVPRKLQIKHAIIYVWVCFFQAILALAISHAGETGLNALSTSNRGWSSNKILTLAAGGSLVFYGFYLAYEYCQDGRKIDTEELKGFIHQSESELDSIGARQKAQMTSWRARELSTQSLFIVAFLGSLDDLTLFVPMLVGRAMSWVQLMIGTLFAATSIITVCVFLAMFKPIAAFLQRLPLYAIILVFASFLLIKGFVMK